MMLAVLGLTSTLALDAPAADATGLADCLVVGACTIDRAAIGDHRVAALRFHDDAEISSAIVAIGDPDQKVVYFDAGEVASSTAHMSEDRDLERYDGVRITSGTLAGGTRAAVFRIGWSHQDYREGNRGHGLEIVSRGAWQPHADVVVCALGDAVTCSKPVRVECKRRGCRVTLHDGALTIATRTGRERFTITE